MRVSLILLISMALVACANSGSKEVIQPEDAVSMSSKIYKIGVGDSLSISVWRNPELTVVVPVRPDGNISVPLIGDIAAAGLEPEGLADQIRAELVKYIKNPQVTVVVTAATSSAFLHRVRVTGAVNSPTSLEYSQGMTVMDIVLVTGGVTEFADANGAKLYRTTQSGVKVYPIRLEDILEKGDISTNYQLQPGDIVTVPERLF